MIFTRTGKDDDTFYAASRLGERYKTSAFKALGTGVEAGLEAPGSLIEDADAAFVNRELGHEPTFMQSVADAVVPPFRDDIEGQGVPMSPEEYEGSQFFREGVEYREGMTVATARLLATRDDAQRKRNFLLEQSSDYVGKGAFFTGALLGSVADVKNIAAGVITGGVVGIGARAISAGRAAGAVMTAARTGRAATLATRAAMVGGEAVIATVPAVVSGLENAPVLGTEYGIEDAFLDLGASAIFSVALAGGASKVKKVYDKYASIGERTNAAEMARAQFRANEHVDVSPMMEAQMAEKVLPFSTVKPGDKPKIRVKADGTVEARFDTETGAMSGVVAKGGSAEEVFESLHRMYDDNISEAAKQLGMDETQLKLIRDVQELKSQKAEFNLDKAMRDIAEEKGADITSLTKAEEGVNFAKAELKDAEVSLSKRKASAKRQSKVANAKQAVLRAEGKLQDVRNSPELRALADEALAQRKVIGDLAGNKAEALKVVQRGQVQDKMSQFVSEQTDPATSHKRSRDPAIQAMDPEEVAIQAQKAPAPQAEVKPSTEVRQKIEERVQSETIDAETRGTIEEGLKQVDDARKRGKALKDWWNCRGGG